MQAVCANLFVQAPSLLLHPFTFPSLVPWPPKVEVLCTYGTVLSLLATLREEIAPILALTRIRAGGGKEKKSLRESLDLSDSELLNVFIHL